MKIKQTDRDDYNNNNHGDDNDANHYFVKSHYLYCSDMLWVTSQTWK